MSEYGYDENSYRECPECEGDKNIVNNACEDGNLMTCPKCNGDGEVLMEYEEFQAKQIDDLERDY